MKFYIKLVLFLLLPISVFSSHIPRCIQDFGAYSMQGLRPTMEDAIAMNLYENSSCAIFGIYDGHGNDIVSSVIAQAMPLVLVESEFFPDNIEKALEDAYWHIDQNIPHSSIKSDAQYAGTCSLNAVITNDHFYIAHLGDSRAILCRNNGSIEVLTVDHHPDNPTEYLRIQQYNGLNRFTPAGRYKIARLGPFAISRAFGDLSMRKAGLIAEPDTKKVSITHDCYCLILACDGIFEQLNNEQVGRIVIACLRDNESQESIAKDAAQTLVNAAIESGSSDNLSAIVILFKKS